MTSNSEIANHGGFVLAIGLTLIAAVWLVNTVANDPLKSMGGALSCRWGLMQVKFQVIRGRQPFYVHRLHEQQGSLVRLGPNEVSTTDLDAVKEIYRVGSRFLKSKWYTDFVGQIGMREVSIFSATDPKAHARHRRIQAHNFSDKWLRVLEPDVVRNIKEAAAGMRREGEERGHFDMFKWNTFMATDIVGEAAFGESFHLLESGEHNQQYIDDVKQFGFRGVLAATFPFIVNVVLARVPFGFIAKARQSARRIGMYGAQSVDRYQKRWQADKETVKPTLLTNEYKLVEDGTLTQNQIVRDAAGYIVAGTDTTAITATYMFWELANHPEIQSQLIKVIEELPEHFMYEDLKHVELFDHIINETLRLEGPASASLPRVVPASGITIGGKFLPPGTIVSTQPYSLHRDPRIWEEPLTWKPTRWENPTKEMRDAFMPFGAGSRICIGMHFAQSELRHALVEFYRAFPRGVTPAWVDGFEAKDMEQQIYFLAQPAGMRCLIKAL